VAAAVEGAAVAAAVVAAVVVAAAADVVSAEAAADAESSVVAAVCAVSVCAAGVADTTEAACGSRGLRRASVATRTRASGFPARSTDRHQADKVESRPLARPAFSHDKV
jgi:hypothetical protein